MKPLIDPIGTSDGQFHGRNTQTGELATVVTPKYMNDSQAGTRSLQQEVLTILAAGGVKADEAANDQLLTALKKVLIAADDNRVKNALQKDQNLGDVADKTKARQSLELKGAAVLDVGNTRGTVAAGDDGRIVNALNKTSNLSDVTDAAEALTNIGGVPTSRTINSHELSENVRLTAKDTGAVSINGGDYSKSFRFGTVSTIPTESNSAGLFSDQPASGGIVCGVNLEWYTHNGVIGLQRDNGTGVKGVLVLIDGNTLGAFSLNGDFTAASKLIAGSEVYESGGGVRVYSSNNEPPYPVTKVNGLTGSIITSRASLAASGWSIDEATKEMVVWGTGKIPGSATSVSIVFPATFSEVYGAQITNIGAGGYAYGVNAIRPGGADIYGEGINSESNFYYEVRGKA